MCKAISSHSTIVCWIIYEETDDDDDVYAKSNSSSNGKPKKESLFVDNARIEICFSPLVEGRHALTQGEPSAIMVDDIKYTFLVSPM